MGNGVARLIQVWLADDDSRTLGTLAQRSGLSRSYLSRLSRGERQGVRPHAFGALSQGLGLPVEDVIEATGATVVPVPADTFYEFVRMDRRLSARQRDGLLHMYYETFGIRDDSPASAQ